MLYVARGKGACGLWAAGSPILDYMPSCAAATPPPAAYTSMFAPLSVDNFYLLSLRFTRLVVTMSNILNKVVGQLSGQGSSSSSQKQPSSGGMFHTLTDAVTGQKHPQDYQNPQMSAYPQSMSSQAQQYPYGGGPGVHGASYAPYSVPR